MIHVSRQPDSRLILWLEMVKIWCVYPLAAEKSLPGGEGGDFKAVIL